MADTYYASVRESVVGANKRHLAVFNGAGSGVRMVVYRITAFGSPTAAAVGLKVSLAALRTTTAPNGTALTFAKARPDADLTRANPDVPVDVIARAAPTQGTVEAIAFGGASVNPEETSAGDPGELYTAPIDGSQQIEFPEGTGFEVRQLTLAGAGAVSIVAVIGLEPNG